MNLREWLPVLVIVASACGVPATAVSVEASGKVGGVTTVPSDGTPLAKSWSDTMHVEAPRVTLDDIIADIGRRQRADRDSLRSVAFTAVVTTVHSPGGAAEAIGDSAGTWDVEEIALRYHQDQGRPDRTVRLWERKQEVKDGVLQPAKVTPPGKPRWQPRTNDLIENLPFAAGGAKRYRYELLESRMVGASLVHVVAFAPRDGFAALPSGVIWVDIADWAIRRVDAQFADAVPFPWLVRAIPRYRLRQAPCGNVWFPVLENARVDLRDLPFTDTGNTYEMRVELRDIVINGEPCDCEEPASDGVGDSAAFWSSIDESWHDDLPPPLQEPVTLAPAQLDSLSRAGARLLSAMPELPRWRVRFRPLPPAFNRSQGLVIRGGATFGRTGGATRFSAELGPGLDDRRLTWAARASTRPHPTLTLDAGGERTTGAFAGDGRPGWRSWSALLWGSDPNHYFDSTAWRAGASWKPAAALRIDADLAQVRELPLAVHSRWNLPGRGLSPEGMRAADALDVRSARAGLGATVGPATVEAGVTRHQVQARVPGIDDERHLTEWRWSARLRHLDRAGHRWTLDTGGRGLDGPAPSQWRVWLGDHQPNEPGAAAGSLCGWPAATLAGDRGAWASLTADLNVDPLRALGVPVLKDLRLQPVLFAEWAGAWGTAGDAWFEGPADGFITPPTGSRADVGLGFARRVDLPMIGVGSRLELRGARAVGEGAGDQGWRFILAVGR